jgi:tetratricopeptide (TPR) repeat protein
LDDLSGDLLAHGARLLQLRRGAEAEAVLRRFLATEPEDAYAHHLLAAALLEEDRAAEAVGAAERAAALAPEAEWAHRIRSTALLASGRKREAVSAAAEATRCEPESPEAWISLALAEAEGGSGRRAEAAAARARALAPESAAAANAQAFVALKQRKWLDAEEHAHFVLTSTPDDPNALNYLGIALMRQGKTREAVHFLGSSARADPRSANPRRNAIAAVGGGIGAIALLQVMRVASFNYADNPLLWVVYVVAVVVIAVPVARGYLRRKRHGIEYPKATREQMRELRRERNEQLAFRPAESSVFTLVALVVVACALVVGGGSIFVAAQGSPDRLPWTIAAFIVIGLGAFLIVQSVVGLTRRSKTPR